MVKHMGYPQLAIGVCILLFSVLPNDHTNEPEAVKCFPIAIEPEAKDIRALVWIENSTDVRVAFFGNRGNFRAYCDFMKLEEKLDTDTWATLVDFDKTALAQEIITAKVTELQSTKFDSIVSQIGYPNPGIGLTELRINLGRLKVK